MDSVREQIINEQARSKVRTEELYNIIKQIADHIDPPKAVPPAPARSAPKTPAPTPAPTPVPAPAPTPVPAPAPAPKKVTRARKPAAKK